MYAYIRKKRTGPIIKKASRIFSEAIEKEDYKKTAFITLWTVLQFDAKEKITQTLRHANLVYKEIEERRGLD